MGLTRKRTIPIHHKPQLPTLIIAIHVPIVMHMCMMLIVSSHFTYNYSKGSHRTAMLVRAKVLGRAIRGKVQQTKGWPPS